jgi:ornithine cyclodeaminase
MSKIYNLIQIKAALKNIDPIGAAEASDEQTTVADLTGVAVQDIQISKTVYEALISEEIK